jgi:hypothetical protein
VRAKNGGTNNNGGTWNSYLWDLFCSIL